MAKADGRHATASHEDRGKFRNHAKTDGDADRDELESLNGSILVLAPVMERQLETDPSSSVLSFMRV
jgi:hypothetical protein